MSRRKIKVEYCSSSSSSGSSDSDTSSGIDSFSDDVNIDLRFISVSDPYAKVYDLESRLDICREKNMVNINESKIRKYYRKYIEFYSENEVNLISLNYIEGFKSRKDFEDKSLEYEDVLYSDFYLPTLMRDNVININIWKIGFIRLSEGDSKSHISGDGFMVTQYGIKGGKITSYFKYGKLYDSIIEIRANYKSKCQEGYYIPGTENMIVRPQLGVTYIPPHELKSGKRSQGNIPDSWFPVAISSKLDGNRAIFNSATSDLTSRENLKIHGFTIIEEHCNIFSKYLTDILRESSYNPVSTICNLDGELYSKSLTLQNVSSIVNTKIDIVEEDKEIIQYYIFDFMIQGLSYKIRHKILSEVYNRYKQAFRYTEFQKRPKLRLVSYYVCDTREQLELEKDSRIEQGYEGIVIRQLSKNAKHKMSGKIMDYTHYYNTRNKALIKYKNTYDENCLIVDIESGVGTYEGLPVFHMKRMFTDEGTESFHENPNIEFTCIMKGDNSLRAEVYANRDDYIGCIANVLYSNITDDGNLQNPRIARIFTNF